VPSLGRLKAAATGEYMAAGARRMVSTIVDTGMPSAATEPATADADCSSMRDEMVAVSQSLNSATARTTSTAAVAGSMVADTCLSGG